ncbi:AraC family transcriptional regulator [Paenibacillus sacheonensis]|uniref:Helix-turn-helix domain-containing protein n=1 Tax=Paenibacillus sacheonensis TaxID=742054 RepID=A0A7X5C135_9BACL|nr:AraC family transcriptional regulator [Paenibacillus sacheonensis]MBM7568537.1 AraC-like DNA-binding protein [Paenibacillus sacheonensis]NBC72362.1 helix-turn-helix domain-containing protein [Paenibacillus sacheonensis]
MTGNFFEGGWRVRPSAVAHAYYPSLDIQNIVYPHWVVSFVTDGEVELQAGGVTRHAFSGQVMLHAPHLPFSERSDRGGNHRWFVVEAANDHGMELLRLYPVGEVTTIMDPGKYIQVFDQMLAAWGDKEGAFREMEISSLCQLLLFYLLQSWERGGRTPRSLPASKNDKRFQVLITHINAKLDEKVSREQLAELVHMNPNYLDRIFAEKFRLTPMQLLRELRLRKARRLLEQTELPLSQIAVQCGMGDAAYLNRQFAKSCSITPGAYRERARLANQNYYGG